MKYSVCIDAVYMHAGIKFTEAMRQIRDAGYQALEFWSWWDKDLPSIRRCMEETGLSTATFCTRFVNPGDASLRETYLDGLRESIKAAAMLNCSTLIAQAGWEFESFPKGITREAHRTSLIETMRRAGEIAAAGNLTLVIEPLNLLIDHPGYHLFSSADAFDLIDRIDCPNVKILFDIYHQQITEGNLIRNITENIDKIGHFHAAGNPGRGEITEGEICYANVLKAIADTGYSGYVGLEYMTKGEPSQGLVKAQEVLV